MTLETTVDAAAAFLRRDWQISASYRVPYLFDLLALLGGVATFFYLSKFVGDGGDRAGYFAFVVAGMAVLRLNLIIPRAIQSFEAEMAAGNLQVLFASPLPTPVVVLGGVLFDLTRALVFAVLLIALSVVLFDAPLHLGGISVAAATLGLLGSGLLFLGVFSVICSAFLVLRQGAALSTLAGIAIPLLAGAYFPIGTLPEPLESVASVLPFRLGVDVVRDGLLHAKLAVGPALGLWAGALVILVVGLVGLDRAVERARRLGTLDRV